MTYRKLLISFVNTSQKVSKLIVLQTSHLSIHYFPPTIRCFQISQENWFDFGFPEKEQKIEISQISIRLTFITQRP